MTQIFGKTAAIDLNRHLTITYCENDGHDEILANAIRVDPDEIARFCLSDQTALSHDLINLCGAVWWADRKATRARATAWARRLEISLPVFETDRLANQTVVAALEDTLRYLTGDAWAFHFSARTDADMHAAALPFAQASRAAMPFSDGLDSYAQHVLLAEEIGDSAILRVRTSPRNRRRPAPGSGILSVPISIQHATREPSFRSRAFVFFVFAALAAAASGANRVVIAENGQGSLAPSLLPFANEWPFRSTHPGFVRRLERWLDLVLPKPLQFVQPQLWRTKGEVLTLMAQAASLGVWQDTYSCSNNHRYQYGRDIACGFCGGCVLRRVSTKAAGLSEDPARYAYSNMASSNLTLTDRSGDSRAFTGNEVDILRHSLRSMREFPEFVMSKITQTQLRGVCEDIDPLAPEQAMQSLKRLAQRHDQEWRAFSADLPAISALRAIAERV